MYIIGTALKILFNILSWAIVIKSLLTWFPSGGGQLYNVLASITEPIEAPIRNIMRRYTNGPMDFTPLVAILVLMLLERVAVMIAYM
ncbi:YggT family protein [Romboutsia sp.]|uniref:YggT family protein n=1 Tax=Romboutsia sp. TaxID=1965302 RepID=UPI003F327AC5